MDEEDVKEAEKPPATNGYSVKKATEKEEAHTMAQIPHAHRFFRHITYLLFSEGACR